MNNKLSKKEMICSFVGISLLALIWQDAVAAATTVATLATNLKSTIGSLVDIIKYGCWLAGTGFLVGGIMKFKQHKDNPTQVTVGQPIALIVIAAALLFMPTLIDIAGDALFGTGATKSMEATKAAA
jgi:intracellular multiplication protein IcmD